MSITAGLFIRDQNFVVRHRIFVRGEVLRKRILDELDRTDFIWR